MNLIEEMEKKIAALHCKNYSFKPVLIHVNGITDELEEAGYFARIISFDEFIAKKTDTTTNRQK